MKVEANTIAAFKPVKPMLATLIKQPFNSSHYIHEVKWDGYRIIAHKHGDSIFLQSRKGENYSKKYPSIVKALQRIPHDFILDGEIVYVHEGKPNFDRLQRVNGQKSPLIYYAFDLLSLDDEHLMQRPLLERKERLQQLVGDSAIIKFSDHFDDGIALYEQVQALSLEGIVSKEKNSAYIPGERGKKWYKIAVAHKQEFVIGGWIESEKRNTFRTLLFGEYDADGKLQWVGHAGSGYKDREMPTILKQLKQLEVNESPFANEIDYSEGKPHWVAPKLIANIKYSTFTAQGKIRKPAIFLGFREDKIPTDVIRQVAQHHIERHNEISTSADSNWPVLESIAKKSRNELVIDNTTVEVTDVEREIWKGIVKADLLSYYVSIAAYILPHVRSRPLSLHIKHNGVHAKGLYIKDMENRQPAYADIFPTERRHKKAGKREVIDYLVCNNTATLLYLINLGCIDINPWTSTIHDPTHPDYIVIDLDPSDDDFNKAIEVAMAAKQFFDECNLKVFAKTSGKTGIHLFIPCTKFTFPQARQIAMNICTEIEKLVPDITTTEMSVSNRGNKLYLDPNQNDYTDTVASAYSVRPYKIPTVSTPFGWKELKRLDPGSFTIHSIQKRLIKKGDLFDVFNNPIAINNDKQLIEFL